MPHVRSATEHWGGGSVERPGWGKTDGASRRDLTNGATSRIVTAQRLNVRRSDVDSSQAISLCDLHNDHSSHTGHSCLRSAAVCGRPVRHRIGPHVGVRHDAYPRRLNRVRARPEPDDRRGAISMEFAPFSDSDSSSNIEHLITHPVARVRPREDRVVPADDVAVLLLGCLVQPMSMWSRMCFDRCVPET